MGYCFKYFLCPLNKLNITEKNALLKVVQWEIDFSVNK